MVEESRKRACLDEPERFLSYLTSDSEQLIKSAGNQEEAVERLRACMIKDFSKGDSRGESFTNDGVFSDPEVLRSLYNEFFKEYRGTGERPSPEVGVLKTEKKMEEELSLIQEKVYTIKQVPQSARIRMGGYSRKGYKPAKEYVRSKPRPFNERERAFLFRNRFVHDLGLLTKLFAANFPKRTKSSVATMKYRIIKNPPAFLNTTKKL